MPSFDTLRSIPQRTIPEGLQGVPTSPTDVVTTDAVIFQIAVGNPTAGDITFSVSDKQSSAKNLINETISANSVQLFNFNEGVKMLKGISWTSGGSGLVAEIFGFYNG